MQQFFVNVTTKRKRFATIQNSAQRERAEAFKAQRKIKEIHYFKTRARAELFIKRDKEKDEKAEWGEIFADKVTFKYAAYKYRTY